MHATQTDTQRAEMSVRESRPQPAAAVSVLVIDRDREFCRTVAAVLTDCGCAVETAHDGEALLGRTPNWSWQAVIIGLPQPGPDGLALLRRLRQVTDAPVLIASAALSDTGEVAALEAGADACTEKNGPAHRLVARLQAFARRAVLFAGRRPEAPRQDKSAAADLCLASRSRTATVGGSDLALTPGEFAVLEALAQARGRVKTRAALYAELQRREYAASDRALDVRISGLRRKLGDSPRRPRFIRTVRSEGYMLSNRTTLERWRGFMQNLVQKNILYLIQSGLLEGEEQVRRPVLCEKNLSH